MSKALRVLLAVVWVLLSMNGTARANKSIHVVASFSILADMVKNVGGDRVTVTALVGPDGDVHAYEPTPLSAKTVGEADLVVVNGLGLEGWLDRLIKASGFKGTVVVASRGVTSRTMQDGHTSGRRVTDPHAWQDLENGTIYVGNIAQALSAIDPAGLPLFTAAADAYCRTLAELHAWVKAEFAAIPDQKRRMITSHDAFGYLAGAYGIDILSPKGLSTESEPSAGEVRQLIRQIKKEKITAVFVENISDPRMTEQIARESGVSVSGKLYSDALSKPDGLAPTYIDMFKNNVTKIVAAMRKGL